MPSTRVFKPLEKIKPIYAGGTITPPKFMPTYYEWLSNDATIVIENSRVLSGGSAVVYKVPKDHFLFITAMTITGKTGVNEGFCFVGDTDEILLNRIELNANDSEVSTINFSIPLKVNPDIEIVVYSSVALLRASGGIFGFLVPKTKIISF